MNVLTTQRAIYSLQSAADYLAIMYKPEAAKRNEGWGEYVAERDARSIIDHLNSKLKEIQ